MCVCVCVRARVCVLVCGHITVLYSCKKSLIRLFSFLTFIDLHLSQYPRSDMRRNWPSNVHVRPLIFTAPSQVRGYPVPGLGGGTLSQVWVGVPYPDLDGKGYPRYPPSQVWMVRGEGVPGVPPPARSGWGVPRVPPTHPLDRAA